MELTFLNDPTQGLIPFADDVDSSDADSPATPVTTGTISLPGFGKPLNYTPRNERGKSLLFPTALYPVDLRGGYVSMPLTTLREFVMMRFMNAVTDKDMWEEKVFDDAITDRWIAEALAIPAADCAPSMTPAMARYCIAELRHKATLFRTTRAVSVYTDNVVKSDSALPPALASALKSALNALEAAIPPAKRDWHPGSDGMVLDLVHPSLYPLVYGKTRILPEGTLEIEDALRRAGEGATVPVPSEDEAKPDVTDYWHYEVIYSRRFQWLPCNVKFVLGEGGEKSAEITSYIPNLHPTIHAPLYPLISQLITHTIPLWNLTLTRNTTRQRIKYTECPDDTACLDEPVQGPDETIEDWQARRNWYWYHLVEVEQPDVVGEFKSPEGEDSEYMRQWGVDLMGQFEGLQVVVKVASIMLTPEKPEYKGGTWHVEGMMNEHICASTIYYYDFDNIAESRLSFRQQCDPKDAEKISYAQYQWSWLWQVFGCKNDDPAVQEIGSITAREGRLVTFPNTLQHKVEPFRLLDPTKPGHRKIVALFLVDPYIKVISTANVPPQRRDWWGQEVIERAQDVFGRLTPEVQGYIMRHVDGFPMSEEEAERVREELMEERKQVVVEQDREFNWSMFSLCEH
ncbi:hypothetical protein BDZ91DRAFT_681804 [Kalaharituber pfeilii]|nr:hypothetical protein BDZ91DRAFT_681804 [Kalaharituber pfeilii]